MTSEEKINRLIEISHDIDRIGPVTFDEAVAYAIMLQNRGIDPVRVLNNQVFLDHTGFDVADITSACYKFKKP